MFSIGSARGDFRSLRLKVLDPGLGSQLFEPMDNIRNTVLNIKIEAKYLKCTQKQFQLKSHIMRKKFLFLSIN
jgi:hypothetical protein